MLVSSDEVEESLADFLGTTPHEFKRSPSEICDAFRGTMGILLEPLNVGSVYEVGEGGMEELPDEEMARYALGEPQDPAREHSPVPGSVRGTAHSLHSESPDSLESNDQYGREEGLVSSLSHRLMELEAERDRQREFNADMQRKCVAMFLRDKAATGGMTGAPKNESALINVAPSGGDANADAEGEKEKQFNDTLQLIADGHKKLSRQQQEFDQLAHDLQTRLDDKEYKASEIAASFREFKQYVECDRTSLAPHTTIIVKL